MSFRGLRPTGALKRAPGPHAVKACALCTLKLTLRVRNFNQKSKTDSFSHKTGNFQILAKSLVSRQLHGHYMGGH